MHSEATADCIQEPASAAAAVTPLIAGDDEASSATTMAVDTNGNGTHHKHHHHYGSSPAWWKPPLKFRPPGAPAGAWPHLPWHASVLHDPYERINFWSHFVPGLVFFVLG